MQYLLDLEMIVLRDRTPDEHIQKIEFSRYVLRVKEGRNKDTKMKGDCVDSSLIICWHLVGGYKFLNKMSGRKPVKMML